MFKIAAIVISFSFPASDHLLGDHLSGIASALDLWTSFRFAKTNFANRLTTAQRSGYN